VRFTRVSFARFAGIGSVLVVCLFIQSAIADEFTLPPVSGFGPISDDDLRFRLSRPEETQGSPVESIWAPLSPYPLSREELSLALDTAPVRSFNRGRPETESAYESGHGQLPDWVLPQTQKHAVDPYESGESERFNPDLGVLQADDPYDESLILNWRFGF